MRGAFRLAALGVTLALALGCGERRRQEAEAAVERAERMVAGVEERAAKIVPDRARALAESLAVSKERLAAGELVGATETARQVQVDAIEIANSLASTSTRISGDFMAFSAVLPGRVERIERRVRQLSGAQLPAGIDRAGFDALARELPVWRDEWKAAVKAFETGELGTASAKADELKQKVMAAEELLGLT
ncbi:MAG: hypothetical protein AB7R55_15620 [Gemmatimonadales bacterium]